MNVIILGSGGCVSTPLVPVDEQEHVTIFHQTAKRYFLPFLAWLIKRRAWNMLYLTSTFSS